MKLSNQQIKQFNKNGFILVPNVFDCNSMDAALATSDHIYYGKPFKDYLANFNFGEKEETIGQVIDNYSDIKYTKFPTGQDIIDRLIENDNLLNIFEQCLDSSSIKLCNAHLFVRSGINDNRHKPNYWEGYHIDHDTNSYLPPIAELRLFAYVNCHVFLHDVDDKCAPMQVIPGSHWIVAKNFIDYFEQGLMSERGNFADIRNFSQFTNPISIKGKKGAVLFYSSYLVHAATAFQNKRLQRVFFGITMVRGDNNSWKRPSWPYAFLNRELSNKFLAKTTPRVRTLLGWPPPGNLYYNCNTLKLLSKWYPGIDLTRYE